MLTLTCPVCDRQGVEEDCCPNCETDLSLIRMLHNLPEVEASEAVSKGSYPGLSVATIMIVLLLGIVLGTGSTIALSSRRDNLTAQSQISPPVPGLTVADAELGPIPSLTRLNSAQFSCSGFRYTVRSGDSLMFLAQNFYGDVKSWSLIAQANPALKQRGYRLEIQEVILIPNREAFCP